MCAVSPHSKEQGSAQDHSSHLHWPGRWGQTLTLDLNRPPSEASSMVNFRDRS